MNQKFNTEEVKSYLEKICTNNQFAKSSLYSNLLTFLVNQALEDVPVKGHTIGAALFDKKYNPVKDDGKVRVYMYNLRKKLKVYYEGVGAEDAIVFSLETGRYNIIFKDKQDEAASKRSEISQDQSFKRPLNLYKAATFILAIALVAILCIFNYRAIIPENTYCWDAFLKKDAVNTIVLADQVVLRQQGIPRGIFYTKPEINSHGEFIAYTKNHPNDSLILTDYTFFTKSIPFSLMRITNFFSDYDSEMILQPESELKYDVVKRGNIVYIGQHKSMSLSKEIFLKNSKLFSYQSDLFVVHKKGKTIKYYPKFDENIRMEYAMVSFMPLEDGRKALYFVSDHDIGSMATVEQFTNLEKLEEFYGKLPSEGSYFNALFKVKGLNRLDVSCELVELEVIE